MHVQSLRLLQNNIYLHMLYLTCYTIPLVDIKTVHDVCTYRMYMENMPEKFNYPTNSRKLNVISARNVSYQCKT